MSTDYRIEWSIEVTADSPIDAAAQALAIQRDADSWAVVFDVYDEHGKHHVVDLQEVS